jgi:RsiW-degrading membrane proteinase PrsW (M82 family)
MILLFISGIIASLLAIVAELTLGSLAEAFGIDLTLWDPTRGGFVMTTFVVGIFLFAIVEEIAKFSILRIQLPRVPYCKVLPLSLLFGIGFAAVELALLFAEHTDVFANLLPAIGIGAIHILTSIAYGLLPSKAPKSHQAIILLVGILSHSFYNLFLALI